jgi:hypothetical protein
MKLIRDALPTVIDKSEGAELQFRGFIEKKIANDQKLSTEIMALSITSRTPREQSLNRSLHH